MWDSLVTPSWVLNCCKQFNYHCYLPSSIIPVSRKLYGIAAANGAEHWRTVSWAVRSHCIPPKFIEVRRRWRDGLVSKTSELTPEQVRTLSLLPNIMACSSMVEQATDNRSMMVRSHPGQPKVHGRPL